MEKKSDKNINQLMKTGFKQVNLRVFIIMMLTPFLTYQTLGLMKVDDGIQAIATLISLFGGVGLAWLWWSYAIVKWKCYAFSKVQGDDIYNLHNRAISAGLIWNTGSFFNKTEIWTTKDKEYWSTLAPEVQVLFDNELFNRF